MIKSVPAPFSLTLDTIERYHNILFYIINKHAAEVENPDTEGKNGEAGPAQLT
jgi:hypothetical protein